MILKIYSVFDSKAVFFGQPFFDPNLNDGSAIRNFSDAVNDGSNPNNMWHKHPEDYSLFYIGDFDSTSGELTPVTPQNLVTASAVRSLQNGSHPVDTKKLEELIQ